MSADPTSVSPPQAGSDVLGAPAKPSLATRVLPPLFALCLAFALVAIVPLRWASWVGAPGWQSTDDAYLRSDLTPLSAHIGGYVRKVAVDDYALVKAGDVIVEIADEDYRAQVAQAEANVQAAEAAIENNTAQQALQAATINAAEANTSANHADQLRYKLEEDRQAQLVQQSFGSRQTYEQAQANAKRSLATVEQAKAQAEAQRKQLGVLKTMARQLEAALSAQRAQLDLARINLSYTRITAPADGMVGERQVRPGQLVASGTQVIALVPLPRLWVVANYKETQLTHMRLGQPAKIHIDAFPDQSWRGHVETIAPASGSQFALLPPDNATGNFTKVVQRVSVKIVFDADGPPVGLLRPGMSVNVEVNTVDGGSIAPRKPAKKDGEVARQ